MQIRTLKQEWNVQIKVLFLLWVGHIFIVSGLVQMELVFYLRLVFITVFVYDLKVFIKAPIN